MNPRAVARIASELLDARDSATRVPRPSEQYDGFDLEGSYAVANELHIGLEKRGFESIGRKIGFTNRGTWKEFDLDTPIWAHVYRQTVHWAGDGRFRLPLEGLVAPRIEPEVVLRLRGPIPEGEVSVEDWATCVEWAAIGFEIVDCHYPDWRFTAPDAVADFGLHARLIVGPPWRIGGDEARRTTSMLASLAVTLSEGSDTKATGVGRNALGGPVRALAHLADVVTRQAWAPALRPGEIVSTGTLTPLPYLSAGHRWRVEVTGAPMAPLEVEVTAASQPRSLPR
jgi:2-keto-4-pentenoate hydratase